MKSFLVLVTLLSATAFASKIRLQGDSQQHHKDPLCKGEPIKLSAEEREKVEQITKECEKQEKEKQKAGDDEHKRYICAVVCIMTKIEVLDDKGFLVESKVKSLIDSAITSQDAKQEMKQGIIECGKNVTGLGTASLDDECSNYKPLFHCVVKTFTEVCGFPSAKGKE